ncbi:MAG TPA: hypothetical protein DHV84_05830 [Desulfotomaculum sp.]|jgi:hypothetical protein|nr:hypothetical protein [Desulfotomaculum sp.]
MNGEELEKIDLLRSRREIGYQEAKYLLDEAGGDIVQVLIKLEERDRAKSENSRFMKWLRKSWRTKIKINRGEQTILKLPLAAGALGLVGVLTRRELALLGGFLGIMALVKDYTLEVDLPEEEVSFTETLLTSSHT